MPSRFKGFVIEDMWFRFAVELEPWGDFFGYQNTKNYSNLVLDFGLQTQICLPLEVSEYSFDNKISIDVN